ncbi:MAG: PIN domain-containing protein [Terracidiphilus sp.]|nr:PIN domain-containing protein [Terracidiphilus sp.]
MAFLIDADVIIQAERKALDLDAWLLAHPDEEIKVAAITVAELWRSVERATGMHRARRQKFLQKALLAFQIVPYTEVAALQHARLWADMEATGQRVSPHDLMLAATALECGAAVVTLNARRFAGFPGLTVLKP